MISRSDIDAIYNAIRPRLKKDLGAGSGGGSTTSAPTTVAPHQHAASEVTFEPVGRIEAEECQASQTELDDEKLARDGSQTMLGTLQMNNNPVTGVWNLLMSGSAGNAVISAVRRITMTGIGLIEVVTQITMAGMGLIEEVRKIDFTGSVAGEGVIDQPRAIHMAGDDADDEARIDGLDRVKFNATETQAVIEAPARVEFQPGVTPGTDYSLALGILSWSDTEGTMVVCVTSGPGS